MEVKGISKDVPAAIVIPAKVPVHPVPSVIADMTTAVTAVILPQFKPLCAIASDITVPPYKPRILPISRITPRSFPLNVPATSVIIAASAFRRRLHRRRPVPTMPIPLHLP